MYAIKAGLIHTAVDEPVKDGVIIIKDGKIADIGQNVSIPEGFETIDATKNQVLPGMIDAHTHLGVMVDGVGQEGSDGNEMSNPFTPHLRALDAIDPFDPTFNEVLRVGITTVMIMPGSANTIGGQCSVLKTVGKAVEDMVLLENAGMKFALGENPKRVYGSQNKEPFSRMGIAAIIRENLTRAKEYLSKKNKAKNNEDEKTPDLNFKYEALADVLSGKTKAHFHCHKAHDIVTAIRIAREFGLNITLEHCTEGIKVIDKIAQSGFPVILSPLMSPRTKIETSGRNFEIAGKLAEEGITVAISTDGISIRSKWLPLDAGICVRHGMKEKDAIRAITINPAKIIDIAHRKGSLEKGKDADLVITMGHPLETRTRTALVMMEGKIQHLDEKNLTSPMKK
ncbi:MAG: amidohydrolase [Vulcanimicrobiota bacterium]